MTTITLALNDAEQQAFHQLLDTALRQGGLTALDVASHFVMRISAAQGSAAQPQRAANAGTTQAPPVPAAVQTSVTALTNQANAGQTAPAHPAVPSAATPTAHAATPTSGNAVQGAQHQSVLSQLIGEITGSTHLQAPAHSATVSSTPAAAPAATAGSTVPPATPVPASATPATVQPANAAAGNAPSASS